MSGNRRGKRRIAVAVVLLAIVAASLITVLTVLPERPSAGGGVREAAPQEGPAEERAPETAPRPSGGAGGEAAAREGTGGPPERPRREAMIAVVIDDVGYSLENLRAFLEFPGPIAFAVLPQLAYTRESARLVRQAGKELLLHLPMEALNGDDPGPGAILSSQSEAEIRRLVARNFADLEGAAGANNHMGSRATADPRVMAAVMQYMADTGRFFLDSRTTPESAAAAVARAAGVEFLERDVFIDNTTDASSMRAAFERGVSVARAKGRAVLIGHVYNPGMLEILRDVLAEMEPFGVRLVPLRRLLGDAGSEGGAP